MRITAGVIFLIIAALIFIQFITINSQSAMHQIYEGTILLAFICSAGFGCLILKGNGKSEQ